MNKATIQKIIVLLTLIFACIGCHAQQPEIMEEETGHTGIVQEAATDQEESDNTDAEQAAEVPENPARRDSKNARLLCLESGDIEAVFGISFGDRIDYNRFTACGQSVYREIDSLFNCYVHFYFQGKGHGFSGFRLGNTELGFLGLDQNEDKLDRLTSLYGEPDEVEVHEKDNSIETVTWNFEKASLKVVTRSGYISSVEYLAADGVADGGEISWEQTDFAKDSQGDYDYLENIYQWEATCGSDANDTEASYHPYDDDYDAGYVGTFVANYLKEQGIRKAEPDGTVYNRRGEPLVEYYIEETENKYCFVVHLWSDYWLDYEAGISEHRDAVYCTTHVLQESDQIGTLLYNIDKENGVMRERLYDTEGMRKADISYENAAGAQIALIKDYWYIETGYDAGRTVLCRSQKFWFDEQQAVFDESGRFVKYHGICETDRQDESQGGMTIYDGYFCYPCTGIYDEMDRLKVIEEDLLPEDEEYERENSGQVEFQYDEKGVLAKAEYGLSTWTHATTDSSGTIEYDETGRMIRNDYYFTHGGHTDIFLYEDGSDLPWACFNWCSYAPGFTNVSLFLQTAD